MGTQQKPYTRTVTDLGHGYPGVSLPSGVAEMYDIEPGDEVRMEYDAESGRVSYILD